jgi:signal transduction histidine kinase
MSALCRKMDWSATALGPVDEWPRAMLAMVRTTLECPFAITLWCGPELNLIYNDAYRPILGTKHPSALARPGKEVWAEIWHDLEWIFASIRAGGHPVYAENQRFGMVRNGKDMQDAWFTFSMSAIRDDDGAVIAFLNVASETTHRMRAELELEEARSLAEHANRAKTDFLTAMSHELRTPLHAIGGYAQLIADEQREDLRKIERSKDHLESLIGDVLSLAKAHAGRIQYDFEKVDVAMVLGAVLEMVMPQISAKHLNLRPLEVPPGLCVYADIDRLRQILINLIGNALKFTPTNGILSLKVDEKDDLVSIAVRDTGIGIPEEKQAHIFEPFVQVEAPLDGNDHGVGLGLAISRELALGMKGDLKVQSVVGQGSIFTLLLPRCG